MTSATAPGKIILAGEHAVVYGRPAIAVPVWDVVAKATIVDLPGGADCVLIAPDVGLYLRLIDATGDLPLAVVARLTLARLDLPLNPAWQIEVRSEIPIASGLGSGAALSAALVRAICIHAGQLAPPALVSELVFESERFYHGTPSGIDNTVIAYGVPIWFVKGESPLPFMPRQPFTLAIADSGIPAPTKETVGDVRQWSQADPVRYMKLFDAIGGVVQMARQAIEQGALADLGRCFDQNQVLLEELGVSSAPLERLIYAARQAGTLGAKLSGGGRGGNIIALVEASTVEKVKQALVAAGAKRVIITKVGV